MIIVPKKDIIPIEFDCPDLGYGLALAIQRNSSKWHVKEIRMSPYQTSNDTHIIGAFTETAAAKAHNGKLNTKILPHGDKHAHDMILPDGRCVEVKGVTFGGKNVDLKFVKDELGMSEYYVLVQMMSNCLYYVYPIWSWDFVEKHLEKANYGYGDRYVVKTINSWLDDYGKSSVI